MEEKLRTEADGGQTTAALAVDPASCSGPAPGNLGVEAEAPLGENTPSQVAAVAARRASGGRFQNKPRSFGSAKWQHSFLVL